MPKRIALSTLTTEEEVEIRRLANSAKTPCDRLNDKNTLNKNLMERFDDLRIGLIP